MMTDGMKWFKNTFGGAVATATAYTPYTLDFLTAIAVQESFEIWGNIFDSHPTDKVLELCVGDTIDGPSRKAFPTSKSALLSIPRGEAIFAVAREELEAVGQVNASYHQNRDIKPQINFATALAYSSMIFNSARAIQTISLARMENIRQCLAKAITELKAAQKKAKLNTKSQLMDEEISSRRDRL